MATITLKQNEIHTSGNLPAPNSQAANFNLVKTDLSTATLADYKGKRVVLNVFPSIDTPTCANSVREFNKQAAALDNTEVLCISRDLPFAQARFCGAEGIDNVTMLSDFNEGSFGKDYGLTITDGPLKGLHSRCVVVLDENHNVLYSEQVPEITDEPQYKNALNSLQ